MRAVNSGVTAGGAARQETLREHNLGLVAHTVLNSPEPLSRADVAAATGLNRATVSRLVAELVTGGLLVEDDPVTGGAPGRPATPLRPAPRTAAGLGLEVSTDRIGGRIVDLTGAVVCESERNGDVRGADPADVLADLGELGRALAAQAAAAGLRIAGTGLAVPGLVAEPGGVLLFAPNLGWRDIHPAELLGEPVPGARLVVGNEARFAALAETAAGPHADSFLYLSGDVGIGSAIVRGGEFFAGEHGWSGEIGHVCVDPRGPQCRCGATGCLETYAGTGAMLAAAGLPHAQNSDALVAALAAGEPRAERAVADAGAALGRAIAAYINLVDVSEVVLGNTLAPLTDDLRPALQAELDRRVLAARWSAPHVRAARTGSHPALTGAARAALAPVIANPSAWLAEGPQESVETLVT